MPTQVGIHASCLRVSPPARGWRARV